MSELTPGLYVSRYVPRGKLFVLDLQSFPLISEATGLAGSGRAVAIHEDDWARIEPAARERLVDEFTRRAADHGIEELRRWLQTATAVSERPQDAPTKDLR